MFLKLHMACKLVILLLRPYLGKALCSICFIAGYQMSFFKTQHNKHTKDG